MKPRKRIGVLGGTFDPIHLGHLRAAESIREAVELDRVVFVPARIPPHKARPGIAPPEDRYRMVVEAVAPWAPFEVSRAELDREGPSYTIDTLVELGRKHEGAQLFCIVGIDAFREIRTWRSWERLLASQSFIIHGRPGYGLAGAQEVVPPQLRGRLVDLSDRAARVLTEPALYLVPAVTLNVSSTEIRALVRQDRSIKFLVPEPVEAYILARRLYTSEESLALPEIQAHLSATRPEAV